jgi:hypothetical protein
MTTIRFREVSLRGVRRWKADDGKWHQKTKRFMQTINPFNKNKLGLPKSYEEIMSELIAERDAWYALTLEEACR